MLRVTKVQPTAVRLSKMNLQKVVARNFVSDKFKNIEDDGLSYGSKKSFWGTMIDKIAKLQEHSVKPGTLILVRHGESEWNHKKLFTGWVDVDLSERGCQEIEHAARLLLERGYKVDIAYTSVLKRAIRSSWIILTELNQIYRPVIKSWRLNERMYGALEGHSKPGLAKVYGEDQVQRWRSGLLDRPPEMTTDHLYYHGNEHKYNGLIDSADIPLTESLQDTLDRTIPLWNNQILPDLKAGRNVLIVAHHNSLRGIVKHIDNISMHDIQKLGIPNGIPLVYKFDDKMQPIAEKGSVAPLSGLWLEKSGLIRYALKKEQDMIEHIAGYSDANVSAGGASPATTNPGDSRATVVNNLSITLSTARNGNNSIENNNNSRLIKSLSRLKEQRNLFADIPTAPSAVVDNHTSAPFLTAPTTQHHPHDTYTTHNNNHNNTHGTHSNTHTNTSNNNTLHTNNANTYDNVYNNTHNTHNNTTNTNTVNYSYNDQSEHEFGGGDILSSSELYKDTSKVQTNTTYDLDTQLHTLNASTMEGFNCAVNNTFPVDTMLHAVNLETTTNTTDNNTTTTATTNNTTSNTTSTNTNTNTTPSCYSAQCNEMLSCGTGCVVAPPQNTTAVEKEVEEEDDVLKRPLLVIIRHGKTAHNQLGLFTGWEDAPLTDAGREEALHAGKLFKAHGLKIDVVYTSWLSRAIETAWIVLNEIDILWLPIVKTWRLNERMYGALTGLSKKMIQQIYGDEQFKKWRRGFNEPPPEISSFSAAYPGNDQRYVSYVQDLDISFFETAIRSLAHGRLEVHRKFPKSESLKNCMERTVPYYLNVIVPDSVAPGKNVLISSSENAIRGLLMHLCDIPQDKIHAVEIPTGLPMIYDAKHKRIRLLDDNNPKSMLERYNFGANPDLLFKRTKGLEGVQGTKDYQEQQDNGIENMDLSQIIIKNKTGNVME